MKCQAALTQCTVSGNLLSASSWVCWRTQPWYHLAERYTDPSGCGKKENLSSLHILVMRTPLYSIQRSLIEDLKCIAHVNILTSKLQLKTSPKLITYKFNFSQKCNICSCNKCKNMVFNVKRDFSGCLSYWWNLSDKRSWCCSHYNEPVVIQTDTAKVKPNASTYYKLNLLRLQEILKRYTLLLHALPGALIKTSDSCTV